MVEWIHAAVAGQAHLEEDGLSAGTIVAFRALGAAPPPLPSDEPADPRATAAGVEMAEAAIERSDDIDRALEQTAAELADARVQAEGARAEAAEASARLLELEQADAGLQSGLTEARRALEEMRAQVDGLRDGLQEGRAAGETPAREEGERLQPRGRAEPGGARAAASGAGGGAHRRRRACAATWPARPRPRSGCASRSTRRAPRSTPWRQRCPKSAGCPAGSTRCRRASGSLEAALAETGADQSVEEAAGAVRVELADARARIERIESERAEERERLERELEEARERLREDVPGDP